MHLIDLAKAGKCPKSVVEDLMVWVRMYAAEHKVPIGSSTAVHRAYLELDSTVPCSSSAGRSVSENRPVSLTRPILVQIPEVVKEAVREHEEQTGETLSEVGRRRFETALALQYHFGGNQVLYRDRPEGREVYAVGSANCALYALDKIPEEELDQYNVQDVELWPDPR